MDRRLDNKQKGGKMGGQKVEILVHQSAFSLIIIRQEPHSNLMHFVNDMTNLNGTLYLKPISKEANINNL